MTVRENARYKALQRPPPNPTMSPHSTSERNTFYPRLRMNGCATMVKDRNRQVSSKPSDGTIERTRELALIFQVFC